MGISLYRTQRQREMARIIDFHIDPIRCTCTNATIKKRMNNLPRAEAVRGLLKDNLIASGEEVARVLNGTRSKERASEGI